MTHTFSDIRRRLRATEQDSAAARVLAGAADRDVSEIRAEIVDATAAGQQRIAELIESLIDQRDR